MKIIRAIHSFFDRLYRRPLGRLLLALIMVGGIFAFAFWRIEPAYLINDDTNIAFTLAGYRTGTPFAAHPFINIALGYLVSGLYGLCPGIPWWFAVQEAALFCSGVALAMCTLRVLAKRNVHWLIACMLFGVLFVGLVFRPIVRVTFTLTSAVLGTAGVALLLAFDREDAKKTRTLLCIFGGIFFVAALLFRNSSGISIACFFFAVLLYRFLDAQLFGKAERKHLKRRMTAFSLCMLLLFFSVLTINRLGIEAYNEDGYQSFDNARADFIDYRLCDTYSDNPDLYQSVGWDAPLYALAMHWCFMDARVTTQALTTLRTSSASASVTMLEKVQDIPARIARFLSNDYFARLIVSLLAAVLAALFVLLLCTRRRNALAFAAGICMLLGAAMLICYLAYCDRLILRTFRLVLMPACFSASLFAVRILPCTAEVEADALQPSAQPHGRIRSTLSYSFCVLLLLFAGMMSGRALADTLRSDYTDEIAACRTVIDYCMAHPDTIFIRDTATCSNLDAVSVYPEQKPVNLLAWGDTDMLTGVQRAQLDLLGIAAPLRMDAFEMENVRYISDTTQGAYGVFASYLSAQGASLIQTDAVSDGVYVFLVKFGDDAS